jgi:hypothetical protein
MPKSRYAETPIIDGKRYGTFSFPVKALGFREIDLLEGVRIVEHEFKSGERLDHLAAKYYNEDSYWWVLALVNGIKYPFASGGLTPGRILKIPVEVRDIFDKIFK